MKPILVAVASVLLLAGCVATPEPEPTPTAVGCTPETAEFSWEAGNQGDNQLVAVQILTYSQDATVQTFETRNVAAEAFIQDADALNMLTDFDQDANAEWMDALLTDVQRTGQVTEKFNTNPDLGDTVMAEPEEPADGTYVVSISSPQVTVPFTISCDGDVVVDSALTSTDSFGFASVAYRCGDDLGDDPVVLAALEYCPRS